MGGGRWGEEDDGEEEHEEEAEEEHGARAARTRVSLVRGEGRRCGLPRVPFSANIETMFLDIKTFIKWAQHLLRGAAGRDLVIPDPDTRRRETLAGSCGILRAGWIRHGSARRGRPA